MRLLLFDIDGTLIRSQGMGRRALDRAFEERYGWAEATRDVSFLGSTDGGIVADVFRAQGRSLEEARREQEAVLARYVELLEVDALHNGGRCEVLPGVPDLLARCAGRSDCQLALLTGNVEGGARIKLQVAGLWEWFPFGAYGLDAFHRNDLLPVALDRAAAHAGRPFRATETVVIGDTPRDIAVAKAHGARSVAVTTGWIDRQGLAQHEPDVLFEDLSRTEAVLEALLG
jgi:phosphoglycolate phosphatase-like HAD superfamily hydrolase